MNTSKKLFSVEMLVEASLMVALALVLIMFPLFRMPQGGEISLAMLPIIIFTIRWGLIPGIIVGAIYGIVSLLLWPYVIHPVQVLLDYPLATGMVGLSALSVKKDKDLFTGYIPYIILGYTLRFIMHFLSGVIFFNPETSNVIWYSFIYNISYLGPELVLLIIVLSLLWNPLKNIIRRQY